MAVPQQENPHVKRLEELYVEARAEYNSGRYAAAEEQFRHLIPLHQRVCGMEDERTLKTRSMHASSLLLLGRNSEAEAIYRDVLQIKQQSPAFGMEHRSTLVSVYDLGGCLTNQSRFKEAEPMLRKVHGIHVRVLGPLHEATLDIQVTLAACLWENDQLEEAERLLRGAWEGYENVDTNASHFVRVMVELVRCLGKAGKYAEAEPICRQAVKLARHTLRESHQMTIDAMTSHGDVLMSLGRHVEAEIMLKMALPLSQNVRGSADNGTLGIVCGLANCMGAQGKAQPREALVRDTLSCAAGVRRGPPNHNSVDAEIGRRLATFGQG